MSKSFKVLRVEYVFAVIIPCLLCIYVNNYNVANHLWLLAGFGFYAMCGNTLNDVIDMKNPNEKETLERVKGHSRKEITTISITTFLLGTACFTNEIIEKPILLLYLAITVILVIIYCLFKSLIFINHVLLGISHLFFPWFMVKINAGDILMDLFPDLSVLEWLVLFCAASFAFTGQMIHEQIDGDSISRFSLRTIQIVVYVSAIISLIIGTISLIMTRYFLFLPFIFFPLGIMFLFRKPRDLRGRIPLKDTGIMICNLFFAYMIILIIAT